MTDFENRGKEVDRELSSAEIAAEDALAVARILAGDGDEFEQLVKRHEQNVFRQVYRLVRNHEEAEDLTQEAFVKAFRALNSFKSEYPFEVWLRRIAANNALSFLRKKRIYASSLEYTNEDGEHTFEIADTKNVSASERLQQAEKVAQLEASMIELTDSQRKLFDLRYREDLEIETIAQRLGRSANYIRVNLHRLRLRLRTLVLGKGNHGKVANIHEL